MSGVPREQLEALAEKWKAHAGDVKLMLTNVEEGIFRQCACELRELAALDRAKGEGPNEGVTSKPPKH